MKLRTWIENRRQREDAFTLVELLVVIVLIGILGTAITSLLINSMRLTTNTIVPTIDDALNTASLHSTMTRTIFETNYIVSAEPTKFTAVSWNNEYTHYACQEDEDGTFAIARYYKASKDAEWSEPRIVVNKLPECVFGYEGKTVLFSDGIKQRSYSYAHGNNTPVVVGEPTIITAQRTVDADIRRSTSATAQLTNILVLAMPDGSFVRYEFAPGGKLNRSVAPSVDYDFIDSRAILDDIFDGRFTYNGRQVVIHIDGYEFESEIPLQAP